MNTATKFLILTSLVFLSSCSKESYESCVDDVVKKAKTEIAVSVGVNNCRSKFPTNDTQLKDCSATWSGTTFNKGKPESLEKYQSIGVSDATHTIYFPKDMEVEKMEKLIQTHLSDIKKICPF